MKELLIRGIDIDWDSVSENSYVRDIISVKSIDKLEFESPVVFFVGENGSGKSTLLEAMAVAYGLNPEGGSKNYKFSTYDSHSDLHESIRLIKGYKPIKWGYFFRAESFYNVASKEEEYYQGQGKAYHQKSHGESFLTLIQSQIKEDSLYFLDEPEAALSPQRQLTLVLEIYKGAKKGAQFFIATHSPILLGLPGSQILNFGSRAVLPCSYEDTESYKVMEMFINNRQYVINRLLNL